MEERGEWESWREGRERKRDGGERSEEGEPREGKIDKEVMGEEMIKLYHTEKRTTHAAASQSTYLSNEWSGQLGVKEGKIVHSKLNLVTGRTGAQ